LEKNPEKYNSYFQWKDTGEFISTEFFCRVCAMTHYADVVSPPKRKETYVWGSRFGATEDSMCLDPGEQYWEREQDL